MICIPHTALYVLGLATVVGLVMWKAPVLLEWVLARISEPVSPETIVQLRASIAQATMAQPHQDPAEARLYGAMRQITPAMRQDWAAHDELAKRRVRRWRLVGLAITLAGWWGFLVWAGIL